MKYPERKRLWSLVAAQLSTLTNCVAVSLVEENDISPATRKQDPVLVNLMVSEAPCVGQLS